MKQQQAKSLLETLAEQAELILQHQKLPAGQRNLVFKASPSKQVEKTTERRRVPETDSRKRKTSVVTV